MYNKYNKLMSKYSVIEKGMILPIVLFRYKNPKK